MDQKFQTSFIPKKQTFAPGGGLKLSNSGSRLGSAYMLIAILLFTASTGAVVSTYFWKQYLLSAQSTYKVNLADREKQFNLDRVESLKRTNVQIDTAKQLLSKHIALSQIFHMIEQMTVSDVRFLSMTVDGPSTQKNGSNSGAAISLQGYGTSLAVVAFQSDVLGQLSQYGLQKMIRNPIVSDPVLDDDGKVSFSFTASIDPASVSYTQSLNKPDEKSSANQ